MLISGYYQRTEIVKQRDGIISSDSQIAISLAQRIQVEILAIYQEIADLKKNGLSR